MDATRTVIGELAPGVELKTFEPRARYYEPMDFLLYLCEDVAYRADRIDPFLTLLWHPSEDRAIGVKLKGCRFLFDRMRAILGAKRINVTESRFYPFVQALEVAMTAGLGAKVMAEACEAEYPGNRRHNPVRTGNCD
jgi:hypothetical protein